MRHYALIGDPVAHSLSPKIYTELFERYGVDADFSCLRIPAGETARVLELELSGFACTMPHKRAVIPYLDSISDTAKACESVNIVRCGEEGLSGFSTDGGGLLAALQRMGAGVKNVALMGTGGAARAAIHALLGAGAKVTLFGRNAEARDELCKRFAALNGGARPDSLDSCDTYINATPLGMAGREEYPSLKFLDTLPSGAAVYDMVYFPSNTKLVEAARARGLNAGNGLSMLYEQAYLAFEIWTGIRVEKAGCK